MHKRFAVALILVLALLGLADSVYLAFHEATGTPLICNIQNLSGCNVVAQSPYSKLFGIPVADYGVLFYSIIAVLSALELAVFDRLLRRALQVIALAGLLVSAYFTFVQAFLIKALCIYCLGSAAIALLLFALATGLEPVRRTAFSEPESVPPAS